MKKLWVMATLFVVFACKKEEKISTQNSSKTETAVQPTDSIVAIKENLPQEINLQTFGFPPEINGCSCYFSTSREEFKKEKYIYIDDYGNTSFLKIDGKMVKFPMKEGDFDPENFNKEITNGEITIKIEGKKIKELEEVMMFQGTMTVENKKGEKTVTPIYGECGC